MADKLDSLDLEITRQLQKNGRISITKLAQMIKSSRLTITSRLGRSIHRGFVIVKGGLNLRKFGFKMASVGLEVKREAARREAESYLRNCPRVLNIFRTAEKANIHLMVWGEDEQTIKSTIESFRDLQNVDLVYTHFLGTPIHGDIAIDVVRANQIENPCKTRCANCYRYTNAGCLGCPASCDYKNPLLE